MVLIRVFPNIIYVCGCVSLEKSQICLSNEGLSDLWASFHMIEVGNVDFMFALKENQVVH